MSSVDEKEREYTEQVLQLYAGQVARQSSIYTEPCTNTDLLAKDLELLLSFRFPEGIAAGVLNTLVKLQEDSCREKDKLAKALRDRRLAGRDYARVINAMTDEILAKCAEVMDAPRYLKLFRMAPGAKVQVVDPETASSVYQG